MKKLLITILLLSSNTLVFATDTTVSIEQPAGTTRILVPIDIPTVLVEQGAIELYAVTLTDWKSKILVDGVDQDNPKSALMASADKIREMVRQQYQTIAEDMAAEQARGQVREQFNQLFN
jgi:hypothetical protein